MLYYILRLNFVEVIKSEKTKLVHFIKYQIYKIIIMKYFKILTIILFGFSIAFYSCKDKKTTDSSKQDTKVPLKLFDSQSQTNATNQNSGSLWHYTCNNGCSGGAPAAGNCSSCGSTLVHNQAFHNNDNNTTTTPTNPTTNNPTTTSNPEPSQNAAGVWHYTCGQGCSGGAGSAGNCSTCGNALAHNTAYHQ